MLNREDRFKQASESVTRLIDYIKTRDFLICPTGQEVWLTSELHEQVRHIYNDKTINLVRYFPNLIVYRADLGCFFIQAKSTSPKYYEGQNFSIELASLATDVSLHDAGIRVMLVFENEPSDFYGNWANLIKPNINFRKETTQFMQGSRTPMALVTKTSIPKLEQLLELKLGIL